MKKIELYFKKNKKEIINYFFIFIFLLLLCFLFPYSHDDWAWGSKLGLYRLNTRFDNYNGRWIGNLLVLLLTRSHALKILIPAITLTINYILIDKIVDSKKSIVRYLTVLFIVAVPHLILMQSVVWVSGFTNYVFPTMLILLYLYFNKEIINGGFKKKSYFLIPCMFILGLISTLCVEHLTIYCLLTSLFFNVLIIVKNKKIDFNNLFYFIGSICGTVMMFANEAYHSIAQNVDTYRNISPLKNAIHNLFGDITSELVLNNYLLNIIISIVLIVLLYNVVFNKKILNILKNLVIIVFVSFPVYTLIVKLMGVSKVFRYIKLFNGLFALLFLGSIFIAILLIFKKEELFKYLFVFFSVALMTGPLLIVSPIGSRCFFTQYLLYAVLILMLVDKLLDNYKIKSILESYIKHIITILAASFYLMYLIIYLNIFRIYNVRQRYLNEHIHDDKIVLPEINSDGFVWKLNPKSEEYNKRYKLFYKVDEKTEVEFIPYKEWKKLK